MNRKNIPVEKNLTFQNIKCEHHQLFFFQINVHVCYYLTGYQLGFYLNLIVRTICKTTPILFENFLKYGSRNKISFCCRCSTFLSPTFVEIKNSFIRTLLAFNSKNFGILSYQKNTDEIKPI